MNAFKSRAEALKFYELELDGWDGVDADGLITYFGWKHELIVIGDKLCMRLTNRKYYARRQDRTGRADPGFKLRLEHISRSRNNGVKCYAIIQEAVDKNAMPHRIQRRIDSRRWIGKEFIEHEGDVWLAIEQP